MKCLRNKKYMDKRGSLVSTNFPLIPSLLLDRYKIIKLIIYIFIILSRLVLQVTLNKTFYRCPPHAVFIPWKYIFSNGSIIFTGQLSLWSELNQIELDFCHSSWPLINFSWPFHDLFSVCAVTYFPPSLNPTLLLQ